MPTETGPTEFENLLEVMDLHQHLVDDQLNDFNALLGDPQILALCVEKRRQEMDPEQMSFNLFHLISDTYYKENLHSDILAAILDPNGRHGAGHAFLHAFINWLRSIPRKSELDGLISSNFLNSRVEREKGRVDISVCDYDSKNAIIIENKIHGACDQPRQLPKYLDEVEKWGFKPVAIVYLTLDKPKLPYEDNTWMAGDHKRVHDLLVQAVAFQYRDEHPSPFGAFLPACEKRTASAEVLFVLRQYGQLIHHLGKNTMNETLIRKLYDEMKVDEGKKLTKALDFVSMMNDLPAFRAKEIIRRFEGNFKPFELLEEYKDEGCINVDASFHFTDWKGVCIDVWSEPTRYCFIFWDRDSTKGDRKRLDQIMENHSMRSNYMLGEFCSRDAYVRNYKFPMEEAAMYSDLELFLKELCSCIDQSLLR